MSTLAENIKRTREALGWTQDQLAEAADVNRVTIAKYEAGKVIPGSKVLTRLAQALRVDANMLLGKGMEEMTDDDRELWELREAARRDPDRKALLKLARHGTAKDVKQVMALVDALRATNPDFYDGDDPA